MVAKPESQSIETNEILQEIKKINKSILFDHFVYGVLKYNIKNVVEKIHFLMFY